MSPVSGNWPDHEECIEGLVCPDFETRAAPSLKGVPSVYPADAFSVGRQACRVHQGEGRALPFGSAAAWEPGPPSSLWTWCVALGHGQAAAGAVCTKGVSILGSRPRFPFTHMCVF